MKIGFEKGILLDTITAFLEGHQPIGKMLRGVLTNASTLDEAIPMLEHTPLASPAYVTPLTVLVLLSVLLSVVLSVVLPVSLSASLSVLLFVAFCSTICTRFFVFRRTATHPLPPPTTRSRPHDSPPIAAHPAFCTKHSFHCITRYLIVGGLDDGIVITRDRDGVATKSQDTSPFFFGREPVPPGVPCARSLTSLVHLTPVVCLTSRLSLTHVCDAREARTSVPRTRFALFVHSHHTPHFLCVLPRSP